FPETIGIDAAIHITGRKVGITATVGAPHHIVFNILGCPAVECRVVAEAAGDRFASIEEAIALQPTRTARGDVELCRCLNVEMILSIYIRGKSVRVVKISYAPTGITRRVQS